LHSPTYRTKYFEFLKIDFPKIPFTDSEEIFIKLSAIGSALIDIHLMKIDFKGNFIAKCEYEGDDNNFAVEQVVYDKGKVRINKERYFSPVSEDIWNFHIGGYQVLDKWLKERKKHNIILESADIEHFLNMISIIDNTIKTMEKIDIYTKDWI
jgi:predicted helicase